MMMMMTTKNWVLCVMLGTMLLSGCATTTTTSDPLVMREGYHKRLESLSVNEAAKISSYFGSTLFEGAETVGLTCDGIVKAVNAQLVKEGKPLRVVFEFSLEKRERFLSLLRQPLSSWHGTPLEPAEVKARLEAASLQEVVTAVSEQLGLNVVWYGGTVVLADHFIGG